MISSAEIIYPAADLSEQISNAGKEASGTGNMKFMLNGALTIATLDGANVEILGEAGGENFFLFGLTVEDVERIKRDGFRPGDYANGNPELADDSFLVLADQVSYLECQEWVSAARQNPAAWSRMSILNTARSGKFSSDQAIAEYCDQTWNVVPVPATV